MGGPPGKDDWSAQDIIGELLDVDNATIATDVRSTLETDFTHAWFGSEDRYTPGGTYYGDDVDRWDEFCFRVQHEHRSLDAIALHALDELFSGLLQFDRDERLVKLIEPGTSIFRARQATERSTRLRICFEPERELGPPPPKVATAGRMNPTGVPVFYGGLSREVCIAELRLPIGDTAISGQFDLIKSLRVLDLSAIGEVGIDMSYFDPEFETKMSRLTFLETLGHAVSRPVLPRDAGLEYVPTQMLMEYLAGCRDPQIDAVIYPSTQMVDGRNIAILQHVAAVERTHDRTFRREYLDDYSTEWSDEALWVFDARPTRRDLFGPDRRKEWLAGNGNLNDPALRLVPGTLHGHMIESIKYECRTAPVKMPESRDMPGNGHI